MKAIAQGAEAIIIKEKGSVIKRRIKKSYRISELDEKIRKLRTRSETKLLEKAGKLISIPKITKSDEKQKEIIMEFIEGKKLSDNLDIFPLKKQKQICKQIGEDVAKLHDMNIIHGDLTTSNMILVETKRKISNFKKQLTKLKKLNLPVEEYAIFGSGPLAIRGIRDSADIDIIVKLKLWKKLAKKYPQETERLIKINSIDICKNWLPWIKNTNELIDDAEIFERIRFVKLKHVLSWKKKYSRKKDKKDVQLIEQYKFSASDSEPNIFFIDFGLGFISHKFEDKAVDIHLLKQALEAKHFKNWEILFKEFINSYKKSKDAKTVLERLKAVEKRGRYKH